MPQGYNGPIPLPSAPATPQQGQGLLQALLARLKGIGSQGFGDFQMGMPPAESPVAGPSIGAAIPGTALPPRIPSMSAAQPRTALPPLGPAIVPVPSHGSPMGSPISPIHGSGPIASAKPHSVSGSGSKVKAHTMPNSEAPPPSTSVPELGGPIDPIAGGQAPVEDQSQLGQEMLPALQNAGSNNTDLEQALMLQRLGQSPQTPISHHQSRLGSLFHKVF